MSEPTDVVYQRSCSPVTGVALVCSAHRITPRKPCSDRSALYLWRAVLQGGNSPGDARTFLHGFTASLTLEALWGGNRTYGSRTHPKEPLGSGAVGRESVDRYGSARVWCRCGRRGHVRHQGQASLL